MSDQDHETTAPSTPRAKQGKTHPMLRWLGYLTLTLLSAGVAGVICGAIALSLAYRNLPELGALTDYRQIGRAHV